MRTSSMKFEMMVDFMQRNGDLAKPGGGPRGRLWATNKWQELAGECRSEEKWRKVNLDEGSQAQQEVELALQDVDSNQIEFPAEYTDLGKEPSCQLDRGDQEWNFPGTSQEQLSPKPAPARKWTPLAMKTRTEKATKIKDSSDRYLTVERDRDKMYYGLEKERIQQRDFELELHAIWIAFMNEALTVFRKVMEEKSKDE